MEAGVGGKVVIEFAQVLGRRHGLVQSQPAGQPFLCLGLGCDGVVVGCVPGGWEGQGERVSSQVGGTQAVVTSGVGGAGFLKGGLGRLVVFLGQAEFAQPEEGSGAIGGGGICGSQRIPGGGGIREFVQLIGL